MPPPFSKRHEKGVNPMQKELFTNGWSYNGTPVTLPHDAMQESGRRPDSPGGSANGFFVGGKYIY